MRTTEHQYFHITPPGLSSTYIICGSQSGWCSGQRARSGSTWLSTLPWTAQLTFFWTIKAHQFLYKTQIKTKQKKTRISIVWVGHFCCCRAKTNCPVFFQNHMWKMVLSENYIFFQNESKCFKHDEKNHWTLRKRGMFNKSIDLLLLSLIVVLAIKHNQNK